MVGFWRNADDMRFRRGDRVKSVVVVVVVVVVAVVVFNRGGGG